MISATLSLAFSSLRRPPGAVGLNVFGVGRDDGAGAENTVDLRYSAGPFRALNTVSATVKKIRVLRERR